MGFFKDYKEELIKEAKNVKDEDLLKDVWYSLNGFYKPEYDSLMPEDIYMLYVERKKSLIEARNKRNSNWEKRQHDINLKNFAENNRYFIIGFFKNKQFKRECLSASA